MVAFCGTAVGNVSAARGEYYAGPGNKFWPILHEIGLTPRLLTPGEYRRLFEYGIGLTDVIKDQAGRDSQLDFTGSDPEGLREKILRFSPAVLAFNGTKAAKLFLGVRRVDQGLQVEQAGETRLFVAPSTSGAARGFWNEGYWYELARMVQKAAS